MVHRAQRGDISVGGHISSYAGVATLYEEYLGRPLSDVSHRLLHRHYTNRSAAGCRLQRKPRYRTKTPDRAVY